MLLLPTTLGVSLWSYPEILSHCIRALVVSHHPLNPQSPPPFNTLPRHALCPESFFQDMFHHPPSAFSALCFSDSYQQKRELLKLLTVSPFSLTLSTSQWLTPAFWNSSGPYRPAFWNSSGPTGLHSGTALGPLGLHSGINPWFICPITNSFFCLFCNLNSYHFDNISFQNFCLFLLKELFLL